MSIETEELAALKQKMAAEFRKVNDHMRALVDIAQEINDAQGRMVEHWNEAFQASHRAMAHLGAAEVRRDYKNSALQPGQVGHG
jgi:DNA anti-recombination protein RmuC